MTVTMELFEIVQGKNLNKISHRIYSKIENNLYVAMYNVLCTCRINSINKVKLGLGLTGTLK